jgi:uncharacterized RDD family membrane protein YckC
LAVQTQLQPVEAPSRAPGRPYQASLFQSGNVIPMEAYRPVDPAPRQRDGSAPAKPRARRPARVPEGQESLDFLASAPPKPRTLGTTVEAVIYCDAPVAVSLHRAVAAALDWSLVLIAYGLFLVVFRYMGGEIVLSSKATIGVYAGVLLLFGFLYGLLWAAADAETPGMQWTRLKLSTFDGFPPEKRQRILRFFGSCLSLCTGLGLAWSLVDEEGLGWQDHISKTFPTPSEAENLIVVRR